MRFTDLGGDIFAFGVLGDFGLGEALICFLLGDGDLCGLLAAFLFPPRAFPFVDISSVVLSSFRFSSSTSTALGFRLLDLAAFLGEFFFKGLRLLALVSF